MRNIYLVRDRGRALPTFAFSHERAARRYIEGIVKRKWKEAIDFERIGANRMSRITRLLEGGYLHDSYEVNMERQARDNEMQQARNVKDAGFAAYRNNYEYNYGLPSIETVKLYRTLADWTAQNAS